MPRARHFASCWCNSGCRLCKEWQDISIEFLIKVGKIDVKILESHLEVLDDAMLPQLTRFLSTGGCHLGLSAEDEEIISFRNHHPVMFSFGTGMTCYSYILYYSSVTRLAKTGWVKRVDLRPAFGACLWCKGFWCQVSWSNDWSSGSMMVHIITSKEHRTMERLKYCKYMIVYHVQISKQIPSPM